MIIGYTRNGYGLKDLKYFFKMKLTSFKWDWIIFAIILRIWSI